jgi:iron complex outermembrane recepter protein
MEKLMIKNVLNKFGFARIALVASVGFPFIVASNTFAAGAAPPPPGPGTAAAPAPAAQVGAPSAVGAAPGAAEVERVIVTGSNIPTAEEVGPNPVFNLNRDLINKSGQGTTTEQLLKTQPVMSASSVPVQNNGTGQAGPAGTASVSLRGFDPGATLVLIDGRRVAPFPGSANSGFAFVDLTAVPVPAIQSVEILKDGASTTYGADAVAGVVNLKLYKDYRGAQVTVGYGNTTDKDAAEYYGDILFGTGTDTTSVTGDLFYYKHRDMFNHDRGNSLIPFFLSSNTSPYNLQVQTAATLHPFDIHFNPQAPPVLSAEALGRDHNFGTPPTGTNGLAPTSTFIFDEGSRVRGSILPGFDFNLFSSSFPKQERWGGYAAFEHKICDDLLRIYADFYYVDAKTHDELAPVATGSFQTPGSPVLFIPPNHPFPVVNGVEVPPFGGPTPSEVGMIAGAFNPFNPFEQIISGGTRARFADFGNRLIDNENIAELFTVGVKGDKLFNGTWGYDGAFRYSQEEQISKFQGVNGPRYERILNGNDSLFQPGSADFIGQTTPYNPLIDFRVPFASNEALIPFATLRSRDLFTSKLATLDLNIYTTDLFDLPAGGVGLAFGGDFERQEFTIDPDDQNRLQENAGVGRIEPVQAGRKTWAIYAETLIPIFSPKWNIPGFYSLEFSAGVRYEEWLNNDSNAAVPKVGVRWQPFDESLTLRSTWGEGYLQPSLVQLFGPRRFLLGPVGGFTRAPGANGFISVPTTVRPCSSADPTCQNITDPETTIENIPNSALHPEHDRTWTGGLVYTPKWIPPKWGTLTLTVDFWDVERTGVAMFFPPSVIINGYNTGKFPGITSPNEPQLGGPPSTLFGAGGDYAGVSSPYLNGGRMRANGVDLGAQYQIETGYGTFTLLSRWTYLNEFIFSFPEDRPWQVAGRTNNDWFAGSFFGDVTSGDAWFKWKGITNLDWTWHNWDLNWTLHTVDGFWEQTFAKQFDGKWRQHRVGPTWFTDAQLSYSLIFVPPVEAAPVPGYSKGKEVVGKGKEAPPPVPYVMPCWKNILNNTTITVGVNNIWGEDPPVMFGFEHGNSVAYPGSTYDNLGRFWYVRMIKKF